MANEPESKKIWAIHGLSELAGTFLLAISLAGLSTIVAGKEQAVEFYMIHPILIGFYAGFIAVGAVLFIFLRWSCDLNPSVTITRMLKGENTVLYGIFKMVFQFLGAIIAGILIYFLGKNGNLKYKDTELIVSNHAIDALNSDAKSFLTSKMGVKATIASGATWIFFIELFMTTLLLFPIFSPRIDNKYRDLIIMLLISQTVWMGILGGSAAINPARGFTQQVPGIFFGFEAGNASSEKSLIAGTIAMMSGGFLAPFVYVTAQGFAEKYFNPLVIKIILFKNNKSTSMKIKPEIIKKSLKKIEVKKVADKRTKSKK